MSKPLLVHVLYRLDYGGLENGLVNVINGLPAGKFRHAIICLAGYSAFSRRIECPDVEIIDLGKRPGKDPLAYLRLWRLLMRLRPDLVHTRNSGAMDCAVIAFAAGVPRRIHGCHGWDAGDLHGTNPKGRRLRRWCHPFIHGYTAVSRDLGDWLVDIDGIDRSRIELVYNGVDCDKFRPGAEAAFASLTASATQQPFVIGTVGRLDQVKDQLTLVRSFAALLRRHPDWAGYVRLAIVGDGAMRDAIQAQIDADDLGAVAAIVGWRDDIERVLHSFTVFCLPSLNEGISNTLLEAMASGLPVVATAVGGNAELVEEGETGFLVPPGEQEHMANALERYIVDHDLLAAHGRNARRLAEDRFSLAGMVHRYDEIYSGWLGMEPG